MAYVLTPQEKRTMELFELLRDQGLPCIVAVGDHLAAHPIDPRPVNPYNLRVYRDGRLGPRLPEEGAVGEKIPEAMVTRIVDLFFEVTDKHTPDAATGIIRSVHEPLTAAPFSPRPADLSDRVGKATYFT
jgi:hypothetical protein